MTFSQNRICTEDLLDHSFLISLFREMLLIRKFEEKVAELVKSDEIRCPCHLYIGQEAIAVGVCSTLTRQDLVFSTHRSHGHYIAKSHDINHLMAELFGKATGCSRGRGGSMHLSNPSMGLPGSSAIVGGTISLAVGSALSHKNKKRENLSVAFFGDGATNEGIFYESLNFASLHKLPIIFVCENNLYSTHLPVEECLANPLIYKTAEIFNIPSIRINGNDVQEIVQATLVAATRALAGEGPSFIECMTYRWCGHVGPNQDFEKGLRSIEEFEIWKAKCPINTFKTHLINENHITEDEIFFISHAINNQINDCLMYAKNSQYPEN